MSTSEVEASSLLAWLMVCAVVPDGLSLTGDPKAAELESNSPFVG